jgi:hypothetical protein
MLALGPVLGAGAEVRYEGFAGGVTGGSGLPVVRVTSLADAGPGTLREALAQGYRTIVFDVAGDIELADFLYVGGSFVTIDGFTAPAPGITLRNRGLIIRGSRGAHDVIVRGLRVRDSLIDGIQIAYGAHDVVIDHVSVHGSGDGNIDITEDSRNVTVSWSILARPAAPQKNMLIKYRASRVTLHHNLFVATQRNPLASIDDPGSPVDETTLDMRNNVIWDWGNGSGTLIRNEARANVVRNFYGSPSSTLRDRLKAILVCGASCYGLEGTPGHAFVAENVLLNAGGYDVNSVGTESTPFAAPAPATDEACQAAQQVVANAGVQPRDAVDTTVLGAVRLPACVADLDVSSLLAPSYVNVGGTLAVEYEIANVGIAPAPAFDVAVAMSSASGRQWTVLATEPPLAAGSTTARIVGVPIAADVPAGVYRLRLTADPTVLMAEKSRDNNTALDWVRVVRPDLAVQSVAAPTSVQAGTTIRITDTTGNRGMVPAPTTVTAFYLSSDYVPGGGDIYLASRVVPPLAPLSASTATTDVTIPAFAPPGRYYLVVRSDDTAGVPEASELNNSRLRALVVTIY